MRLGTKNEFVFCRDARADATRSHWADTATDFHKHGPKDLRNIREQRMAALMNNASAWSVRKYSEPQHLLAVSPLANVAEAMYRGPCVPASTEMTL